MTTTVANQLPRINLVCPSNSKAQKRQVPAALVGFPGMPILQLSAPGYIPGLEPSCSADHRCTSVRKGIGAVT
jgi:hypothetical protein